MSVQAIAWSFQQNIKPSSVKFVLVALCDYTNEVGLAYPSIARLCEKTSLNRKTVLSALSKLCDLGYLVDTGERKGATSQVRVYQITVPESGHLEEAKESQFFQERVPFLPTKSPKNGTRNHKGTEREPNGGAQRFRPPSVDQVRTYCQERGNGIDPEAFVDYYKARGWMVGKSKMKDWQAAVRTWERKAKERPRSNGSEVDGYPSVVF